MTSSPDAFDPSVITGTTGPGDGGDPELLERTRAARTERTRQSLALLITGGVALVGLVIPSHPWPLLVARSLLIVGALGFGCYRLWVINALTAVIERRPSVDDRTTPRP